jgi:hypothetical protein
MGPLQLIRHRQPDRLPVHEAPLAGFPPVVALAGHEDPCRPRLVSSSTPPHRGSRRPCQISASAATTDA